MTVCMQVFLLQKRFPPHVSLVGWKRRSQGQVTQTEDTHLEGTFHVTAQEVSSAKLEDFGSYLRV